MIIVLALAEHHEDVTVYADETELSTDIEGNVDTVVLDNEMLQRLPLAGDDVVAAVSELVRLSTGGSASVVVDGLETPGASLTVEEIEEIKINKNPYSAEFRQPGSNRIVIRTKSGSTSYHGSFRFGFNDYRLNARNAFAVERPPEQRRTYSGSLSGPIGKTKKTTFFLSVWRDDDDQHSIVNAITPDGGVRHNILHPLRTTTISSRTAVRLKVE